jgi:hypothetical protein
MWYKSRLLSVLHGVLHLQSIFRAKMRFVSRPQRLWKRLSIACSALLAVQALAGAAIAQPAPEPTQAPPINEGAPNKQPAPAATAESRSREAWHATMSQTPTPKKGCFTASYPNTEWQEVPCTTAPPYPMPPRRGPRPDIVGNANDVAAQAPSGFISTATGSFDSVNGVTSESGPIGNSGPPVTNAYTLQLNTNFMSNVCSGSPNPACQGWQQFVFWNDGSSGSIFIQYWLIKYNATCPAGQGWNQFSFTGSTDIYCWKNDSMGATPLPSPQPITNLGNLRLSGTVGAGGDSATLTDLSTGIAKKVTGDNAVNAAAGWQIAEFNVFGPGGNSNGGSQASFNSGSTINARTRVIYGGTAPPVCVAQGFTAETNNLSFGPTAPTASQPGPALIFDESSAGGAPSNCVAATSVGDTHLATFNGLFYDFQASGDFVLAQVDPDFVVQTRQVSGAPTWPNADVNNAVATRMGKTRVAICLAPARLNIDGKTADLADGKSLSLPGGVDVKRNGNVYLITGESGDSVRAEVNASWINVSVGLGRWPAKVRGLIANANGNVNEIETRDGIALAKPFSFADLYRRYADSWRVPSNESLLRVCGDREIESGIPTKTFYANDLDPKLYERARAVCIAAGVKGEPLLDACTLDVTVIGSDTAAQVFVGAPAPIAVGGIVNTPDNSWKWLMWLVLALVIAFLLGMLFLILRKTP